MVECPNDRVLQEDLERTAASESVPWERFRGATVLVTGAAGLVGSQLVRTLLCADRLKGLGLHVLALERDAERVRSVFGPLCERDAFRAVIGDVTAGVCVDEPVHYIVHGASVTNSKQMVTYPVETVRITVDGTRAMLDLAREKQVRGMVYLSSMEVYGVTDPLLDRVSERDLGYVDPLSVRSSYPEGKRLAECLCAAYAHQHRVPVCVARLAQTFGAGVRYDESRVFAQFARSHIDCKDIILHTSGEAVGNYCYTADCVRALLILLAKGAAGEAYNVVNPRTAMTIREMAELVASLSGGNTRVVTDIPSDAHAYGYAPPSAMRLNGEKMRALGFEAETDLPEMYQRLIASMKQQKGLR